MGSKRFYWVLFKGMEAVAVVLFASFPFVESLIVIVVTLSIAESF